MITIDLGNGLFTYVILIALGIFGWTRGFRYMLSIAAFITIGYLLTVQGGNFIVGLVNRFYQNGPPLAAFIVGRDPSTVARLPPLIPDNLQAPLLLRVLIFLGLLAVGIGYAFPWEGKPLSGFNGFRPLRILGALAGLYIGILGISAVSDFWNESGGTLNLPDALTRVLNALPTFSGIVPSIIAAFLVLLVIIIILRFNRIFLTDAAAKK